MMTEQRTATVLVVDDDHDVRRITSMLLERAGYAVIDAQDGSAGIEVLRDHLDEVDVVLLDVTMPRMSGHEALPAMRQLRPDLPVVFFSGYGPSEVAHHLGDDQAYTAFLPKPSSAETLTEALERALPR